MTWVSQRTEPSLPETQLIGVTLVSGPILLPRWSVKVSTWALAGNTPTASDSRAAVGSTQPLGQRIWRPGPGRQERKGNMPADIGESWDRAHFGASIAAVVFLSNFLKQKIQLAQGIGLQVPVSWVAQGMVALIFL